MHIEDFFLWYIKDDDVVSLRECIGNVSCKEYLEETLSSRV